MVGEVREERKKGILQEENRLTSSSDSRARNSFSFFQKRMLSNIESQRKKLYASMFER